MTKTITQLRAERRARAKREYYLHLKEGWRQCSVFGPPQLVEAVKAYVKQFKQEHGLYERGPHA